VRDQWTCYSRPAVPILLGLSGHSRLLEAGAFGTAWSRIVNELVLLFTSLLAIPLARQSCLDATLFTRFEVVGVTFYFLDNVFLLNLTLEPA